MRKSGKVKMSREFTTSCTLSTIRDEKTVVGKPIRSQDRGEGHVQMEVHAGLSRGATGLM